MKITSFNPMIVTRNPEPVIALLKPRAVSGSTVFYKY